MQLGYDVGFQYRVAEMCSLLSKGCSGAQGSREIENDQFL